MSTVILSRVEAKSAGCQCRYWAGSVRGKWRETPIFMRIAWELDLHWTCDNSYYLFWQHDRYSMWPMETQPPF